jgi:hypothetical protein
VLLQVLFRSPIILLRCLCAASFCPSIEEDGETGKLLIASRRPSFAFTHCKVNQLVLQLFTELLKHQVAVVVKGCLVPLLNWVINSSGGLFVSLDVLLHHLEIPTSVLPDERRFLGSSSDRLGLARLDIDLLGRCGGEVIGGVADNLGVGTAARGPTQGRRIYNDIRCRVHLPRSISVVMLLC